MNNGGFLSTQSVRENQLANLSKQIDDLKDQLQQKDKEIERLENIRKEIREYIMSDLITEWDIENDGYVSGSDLPADAITPILEILDKEVINNAIMG